MSIIRRATKADIPQLMNLLLQVCQVHHISRPDIFKSGTTKYTEQQLEQLLQDDASPVFVYDEEGVQAYLFVQVQNITDARLLQDRKTLYIDDLCVDERVRGRGIGQQMFTFARDYAQSIGCDAITLNVWEGNNSAWAFYQRLGMHVQKTTMEVRV